LDELMATTNWNELIKQLPNPHILQTEEWARQKQEVGWEPTPLVLNDDQNKPNAAGLVLTRSIRPFGIGPRFSVCYVPRGPLLDWGNAKLRERIYTSLEEFSLNQKAIFIKIDPEIIIGTGIPGSESEQVDSLGMSIKEELTNRGWRYSSEQIQFKNTVLIDLRGSEEDWLKRMKQKTRYNIRLAQRAGVIVRPAEINELPLMYKMYAHTAARDSFIIREEAYYLRVWTQFIESNLAYPLVAMVDDQPVAGLILFAFAHRAWYLYGMSTVLHREKMPNYLLQWEAMRKARELGCESYDLWGAPDKFDESDAMFGVFRFKEGLGGEVVRTIGAWDFPTRSFLYYLYQRILPRVLDFTRWIRRGKIKQEAG
jgi:peptidoglycan pentaglycine glycine transferase (the first glycine)